MKKILIAIICLCFALSMVACNLTEDYYNPQISMDPPSVDPGPNGDASGVSHKHLEKLGKDNVWIPVADDETVFDSGVLWEPGYTQMQILRVVRKVEGEIKYKVDLVADGELGGLAEYIDVLVMPGLEQLPAGADALDSWVMLAPLDLLIGGDNTVSQGFIFPEDTPDYVSFGIALRVNAEAEAGLTLGATLDLNVTIEYADGGNGDSFGDAYDENVGGHVSRDPSGDAEMTDNSPSIETANPEGARPVTPDKDHTDKEEEKKPVDTNIDTNIDYNGDGVVDGKDWGEDDGKAPDHDDGKAPEQGDETNGAGAETGAPAVSMDNGALPVPPAMNGNSGVFMP